MKYMIEQGDELGDHEDQIEWARWDGYGFGVDYVLTYIRSIHRYPKLLAELDQAIKERVI